MRYEIYEGNMDRLDKKLTKIRNKCQAYGCDFHYEILGDTFRPVKDDKGNVIFMTRYIVVEVEGTAVVENWEFIASVEHTEAGNIFKGIRNAEVPKRYYQGGPVCEHCNTVRPRKYSYIVRNKETGEYKQVGKSCLNDYTHGMSAEMVANYLSMFDTLVEGEAPLAGAHIDHYLDKEKFLRFAAETIRCYGYVKASDDGDSTAARTMEFYEAAHGRAVSRGYLEHLQEEMEKNHFDPDSPENVRRVKEALDWIKGWDADSNYIHNLKVVCDLEYVTTRNFGLLASLFVAYERHLKFRKEQVNRQYDESGSKHVGQPGERVTIQVGRVKLLTSWDNAFGTTRMYKLVSRDGNVFIWRTGSYLKETFKELEVTGTVKVHGEFNGIRQTEVTRCSFSQK